MLLYYIFTLFQALMPTTNTEVSLPGVLSKLQNYFLAAPSRLTIDSQAFIPYSLTLRTERALPFYEMEFRAFIRHGLEQCIDPEKAITEPAPFEDYDPFYIDLESKMDGSMAIDVLYILSSTLNTSTVQLRRHSYFELDVRDLLKSVLFAVSVFVLLFSPAILMTF
jgi:hypothetical protein